MTINRTVSPTREDGRDTTVNGYFGVLIDGPCAGAQIAIDPHLQNIAVIRGHWYVRAVATAALGRSKSADYRHDPKCCLRSRGCN